MISCGCDLLLVKNLANKLSNPEFSQKTFQNSELRHKEKLPSIFALKEAAMKALGKKIDWKDIEVSYNSEGKPIIQVPNLNAEISCSLSHDGDYILAFVIINSK